VTCQYSLAIWHGWNMPLIMSLVAWPAASCSTCCAGSAVRRFDTTPVLGRVSGRRIFENLLARITWLGRAGRRNLSTRRLQWQMLWLVCVALVAAACRCGYGA
jgi:multicomponent K+:H+ antiporter subunit A